MVHLDGVCWQQFTLLGEDMLILCKVGVIIIILVFNLMNSSLGKLSIFYTVTNLKYGISTLPPFVSRPCSLLFTKSLVPWSE